SNLFATRALEIGSASIALSSVAASIVPRSDRSLTFDGQASVSVPGGAEIISDPLDFCVPPFSNLAVSLYFPSLPGTTAHGNSLQTNYVSSEGNHTKAVDMPVLATLKSSIALSAVDVAGSPDAACISAFGDCITDGLFSTPDTNRRWIDVLAMRLAGQEPRLSVVNCGIAGNRVLRNGPPPFGPLFGTAGTARFECDVLGQAGLKFVIMMAGITDISHPGSNAPAEEEATCGEIIEGLQKLIDYARSREVRVIGATLTPFENAATPGFANMYSPAKESKRQEINSWIRSGGSFEGIVDFDRAVCDPIHPARLLPQYDGGDHIHLNDAGHEALGNAVDVSLFRKPETKSAKAAGVDDVLSSIA